MSIEFDRKDSTCGWREFVHYIVDFYDFQYGGFLVGVDSAKFATSRNQTFDADWGVL